MATQGSDSADALCLQADRLSRDPKQHSSRAQPGFLQHASGKWRSPELHARIIELFTRAIELNPRDQSLRHRRAVEHLHMGEIDAAQQDFDALMAVDPGHAATPLAIWISLRRADRPRAQHHLDALNAVNRKKGLPIQTLDDFDWL
jgi:predicted Zn-dependent protease